MQNHELQSLVEMALPNCAVTVGGDGRHVDLVVVSDQFVDQSRVKRQQLVYAILQGSIASGDIHAVNMQTYTTQEWEQRHG